jgi:hypothetical protein
MAHTPALAALADLPAAQVPEVRTEACIMFTAMTNVELSGARKRIRSNEMLDRARELATNALPLAQPRQRPREQQHFALTCAGRRCWCRQRPKRHR